MDEKRGIGLCWEWKKWVGGEVRVGRMEWKRYVDGGGGGDLMVCGEGWDGR